MATDLLDQQQSASTDIATIVTQNPVVVLVDSNKRNELYAHIQREIDAFTPDVSTNKGREAIKSLAFKITRTKTAIDAAGKALNEEARTKINVVDAARRDARNTLEIMAETVRQPLTDWEEAEKASVAECRAIIDGIWVAAIVTLEDTAAIVRARGTEVYQIALDPERFGELLDEAQSAKEHVIAGLRADLARLVQAEADAAELARLKAAEADRLEREENERLARKTAEREAEDVRRAEEARKAAEQAEADRIAKAAEKAAQDERDRLQKIHDDEIAIAAKRVEDAEASAAAERKKAEDDAAARKAEEDRLAAEQRKRDEDQAHRTKVKTAVKQTLMTCGADEETAKKIVMALVAKEIPHVVLSF